VGDYDDDEEDYEEDDDNDNNNNKVQSLHSLTPYLCNTKLSYMIKYNNLFQNGISMTAYREE